MSNSIEEAAQNWLEAQGIEATKHRIESLTKLVEMCVEAGYEEAKA